MNTVKVVFRNGCREKFINVKTVVTDINYGIYQLTHLGGSETYIKSEVIEYIQFGERVKIIVN